MKKISSGTTFLYKWAFPIFWFGFLAVFAFQALSSGAGSKNPMFLLMPVFMAVVGYFMMKKMVWVLADEVYDCGSFLLVKNRGKEERIELSNVMNVSATTMMNPPQITLRLSRPLSDGGNEVTFSPPMGFFRFNPFSKSEVAEDLIVRVDRARRGV
jgi:hypothetical protein